MSATWNTWTARLLLPALAATALLGLAAVEPARAQQEKAPAEMTVVVPANAEVFFDGAPTTQKGTERLFVSPALEPGKKFSYDVLARWKENGKAVERSRTVGVASGASVRVSFLDGPAAARAADGAEADKETINSTATKRSTAAAVKFRKELGLPLATLNTLGSRIDAARRAHDPVALANAASELDAAEKASGKKASLTALALARESAELAKLRRQETELRSLVAVQQQITGTDDTLTVLKNILSEAKAQAAADSASIRANQEPTWKPRTIVVNNYTTQYIDVWCNGFYKVQVAPGMAQSFVIEHRWNPVVLTGDGDEDETTFGPVNLWGRFNKYTWNIN
jgi:uncharacterized protein (TIGR03000 family)